MPAHAGVILRRDARINADRFLVWLVVKHRADVFSMIHFGAASMKRGAPLGEMRAMSSPRYIGYDA